MAAILPAVFFDVDDTLLTWDHRLRPHARDVIGELSTMGCAVYIWSGVGVRWEVVDVHGLRSYVRDCYLKPLSRHRERLRELQV